MSSCIGLWPTTLREELLDLRFRVLVRDKRYTNTALPHHHITIWLSEVLSNDLLHIKLCFYKVSMSPSPCVISYSTSWSWGLSGPRSTASAFRSSGTWLYIRPLGSFILWVKVYPLNGIGFTTLYGEIFYFVSSGGLRIRGNRRMVSHHIIQLYYSKSSQSPMQY